MNVGYKESGLDQVCGYAHPTNKPGTLYVEFPTLNGGDYNILDTDYENFAAIYSCMEHSGQSYIIAFLLTRSTQPTDDYVSQN